MIFYMTNIPILQNYEIIWAKRAGFAKVALEANVPIIPVFTQNIREVIISNCF